MPKRILIVDDDPLLRRSVAFSLEQAGYQAVTASRVNDALPAAQLNPPDLILLDIGLPDLDGLEGLKIFKERFPVPVIFLTARRRSLDQVVGLELGADDYITKPFDVDVLIARIKTVLRRAGSGKTAERQATTIIVGDLSINPASREVNIAGRLVELTRREFDLLYSLALRPAQVISIDELLGQVWGAEFVGQPEVVYVHIRWLREKIEQDPAKPQRIISVRGVGYKLQTRGG